MNLFKFVSQYFWLICIAVAVVNFLMMDRIGSNDVDVPVPAVG